MLETKKEDDIAVLEIAGTKSIAQDVKEKGDLDTDICETDFSNGNNSDAVSDITIDSSYSQEDTDHNVMTDVLYIVFKEDVIKLGKEKFEKYLERCHMLQDVVKRFIYNIWSNIVQVEVPDKYVNLTFKTIATADDDENSDVSSQSNQRIVKLVAFGSDSDNGDSDGDDFETPNSEPPPKLISSSLSPIHYGKWQQKETTGIDNDVHPDMSDVCSNSSDVCSDSCDAGAIDGEDKPVDMSSKEPKLVEKIPDSMPVDLSS